MNTPITHGVLTIDVVEGRSAPLKMTFSNRDEMDATAHYVGKYRPDLKVVDLFWGYQTFLTSATAIDTINAFHPSFK
jgi:hypothetical protein